MKLRMRQARPALMWSLMFTLPMLTGCAMLPDAASERAIDEEKVQSVERAARANGVMVRWVNYPIKSPR